MYIDGANITAQLENSSKAIPIVRTLNGKKTINMVIQNSVISYDETQFKLEDVTDVYDNIINLFTVDGLQPNTKVKRINGQPVTGLQTAEDGSLKCLLEYGDNVITLDNGENYIYTYQWDEETQKESMVKNDTSVTHKVTLRDEGESGGREIIVADGFELGNRYFDGQKYYKYDSAEKPEKIIDDVTITLHEVKEKVTVDGTEWTDDVLPTGSFYMATDKEDDKFIAYPGDTVQQGTSYTSFLKAVQKEGKWFVKIENRDDLDLLNENLWYDNTLNILLETDLDFSGEDCFYLLDEGNGDYYGTFDGNGHGITNVKNKYYSSVLILKNYGTIKNVHIKNASIPSDEYSADFQSGILCARNYGTIENCSVESSTVETKKRTDDDDEQSIKLRVHSALVGGNYGTIKDSFAKDITFNGDGETYPICKSFAGSKLENTYYLSEKTGEENAKTAEQFASGEVCSLLNHGVTDGSQYWHQNIDNGDERDAAPVADPSHGIVYAGYQGCVKVYSNAELQTTTPSHEAKYTANGNTITGICKNDSSHNVQLTVSANDVTYDGKAHPVTVGVECSDEWGEEEVPYKIVYTRGENPTEDLTSPGTIKATLFIGSVQAEVTYTIKAAPTAVPTAKPTVKPTAVPMASPSATPSATPTVSPSAVPSAGPTATPAGTNPGSVPSAGPSEGNKSTATPAPSDKSVIAPGETKAPAAAKAPETAGTKIASKKGDTYKVTDTSGKIPEVELTKSAAKKKAKTVVIPKTVKVDGVNYKVTAIAEKAFAGNKKLKTVVIGADIEKIGAKAFYKCVNLKKVTIQTTKLKAKTVGTKAFAKIHKKAVVKVPKAKKKAYKKWLKKRGIGGKQKITGE